MEDNRVKEMLREKVEQIEAVLKIYLPAEEGYQKKVIEAMNYSLMAGGKRLRPMLMQETYKLFGGSGQVIRPFMAAIEMIHTYSLVHDDLPAMDDDEYRRGRKTTHVVYGEAFGILAGDGLLNYAFETALTALEDPDVDAARVGKALSVLARKAGIYGMIGGQTADIEAEDQATPLTGKQLLFIHEKKTAALIQAAMMVGAILAGASEEAVSKIEKCAYNIGIAFQIQDDILDVIGDSKELGKPVGSDEKNHKQTFVTLNGLEQSRKEVALLSEEAVAILTEVEGENTFLTQLILTLIDRRK
ncbi:MAG: polyprenyl synthetase family protein [Lachnospiraceae bacterium]|nr:polyprenyl synthetase family protein [Lachnospiraceae bacterium]